MSLREISKEIRSFMSDAATGPLVASKKVVELGDNWENYQNEVDGMSFTSWLIRELGNTRHGYSYFAVRNKAVNELGEHIRRTLHHEVAVYVYKSVLPEFRGRIVEELTKVYIKNNRTPASMGQAMPIIHEITGYVPQWN